MTAEKRMMTLAEWRAQQGLTQQEAAEKLGARRAAWSAWELREKKPSVEMAATIHRATRGRVPVSFFFPCLAGLLK